MKWCQRLFQTAKSPVSLLVAAIVTLALAALPTVVDAQKVLLKDVRTLTLHRGKMTTGRRSSPVPQMNCVGGNACGDFEPGNVFAFDHGTSVFAFTL